MGIRHSYKSLDDLFNDDPLGLLADVQALAARPHADQVLLNNFSDLREFYRQNQQLPSAQGNIREKGLVKRLLAIFNNLEDYEILLAHDPDGYLLRWRQEFVDLGLLSEISQASKSEVIAIPTEKSEESIAYETKNNEGRLRQDFTLKEEGAELSDTQLDSESEARASTDFIEEANNVQSLDDILANDVFNLLDVDAPEIYQMEHVSSVETGKPYSDEDNAVRKPCEDFWKFEGFFKRIHESLAENTAHFEQLRTEQNLKQHDVFLLHGALCYIAEVNETEQRKSDRKNFRLRVIYENGTESNILMRSLARAVYKDPYGKQVILHTDDGLPELFVDPENTGLVTGHIYVVKMRQVKPELQEFKHLHKIGFTTGSVEKRIADAKRDIAFLESEVYPVLSFECRHLDPYMFERLIHTFLGGQRLKLILRSRDGLFYTPSEWFDVELDVIEQVANAIINETINQYRMDNTTGRMVRKG